jgi:SNF2 family DNA or RNA helicase
VKSIIIDWINQNDENYFVVSGYHSEIIGNKRLVYSLKRLKYFSENEFLYIPFRDETQIQVLQDLEQIFCQYGYSQKLTDKTNEQVDNYNREERLFQEFSNKAKYIRNNEFNNHKELINDFICFKECIENKLERRLYDLQLLSAFHMAFAQNSCNFAVPGAGKTSIVYGAYAFLNSLPSSDERYVDKLLVIGPLSSFWTWEDEYSACFGRKVDSFRMSGDSKVSREEKLEHLHSADPDELTLIFHGGVDSYQNDLVSFLLRNKTMVVIDEAHRIKNPEGVWGRSVIRISKEAKSRVALTGTPLPNGYQDIFNLFKFIFPFRYRDILKVHYENLLEMTKYSDPESLRVSELKENIAPYYIRIKKKDLNLPAVLDETIPIYMGKDQREIYDFIESEYIDSFCDNGAATVKDLLNRAKLIRLRQAATNPSLLAKTLKGALEEGADFGEHDPNSQFTINHEEYVDDSAFFNKICNYSVNEVPQKFICTLKIIEKEIIPSCGKVIIWTIFINNAKSLQSFLGDHSIESELLIGEVPTSEREIIIKKFNNPDNNEFQVVIANPFSVAESISLHKGCHNAIYLERDYNCANFLQSKDRIHRVGLEENQKTKYYYLIAKDSVDEVINQKLEAKIQQMEAITNDDIPLFSRIDDNDETDIISGLLENYANRS